MSTELSVIMVYSYGTMTSLESPASSPSVEGQLPACNAEELGAGVGMSVIISKVGLLVGSDVMGTVSTTSPELTSGSVGGVVVTASTASVTPLAAVVEVVVEVELSTTVLTVGDAVVMAGGVTVAAAVVTTATTGAPVTGAVVITAATGAPVTGAVVTTPTTGAPVTGAIVGPLLGPTVGPTLGPAVGASVGLGQLRSLSPATISLYFPSSTSPRE
mmetsp:Transcript_4398/g.7815  ORF Transcript_4398/g.7815 Transcript_4398/m.7815 type:complete len:216 (+) Transcript_4398:1200-1847(+)